MVLPNTAWPTDWHGNQAVIHPCYGLEMSQIKLWDSNISSLHKHSLWLNVHRNNPKSVPKHGIKDLWRKNKCKQGHLNSNHWLAFKITWRKLCKFSTRIYKLYLPWVFFFRSGSVSYLNLRNAKHSVHRLLLDFWFNTQWEVNSHNIQTSWCCINQFF